MLPHGHARIARRCQHQASVSQAAALLHELVLSMSEVEVHAGHLISGRGS